jgi:hypothetical protein
MLLLSFVIILQSLGSPIEDLEVRTNIWERIFEAISKERSPNRPRNPRFKDAHTGRKRRLEIKKKNRDSGISGSEPKSSANHLKSASFFEEAVLMKLPKRYATPGRGGGLHQLKNASKMRSQMFVRTSKSSFGEHKHKKGYKGS